MIERANPITNGYALEVSSYDLAALRAVAPRIERGTHIAIPYLPREDNQARLATAQAVRHLGFEPMPHLSARRIASLAELEAFVTHAVADAGVAHCFVVAGDPAVPIGPFADSSALIDSGVFERAGIQYLGVAGHTGGHPVMGEAQCWEVLERKCNNIAKRGMQPLIVTQFAFDADMVLTWLLSLRQRGLEYPVRIGVPGPAGIAVLARYARVCGVRVSVSMWAKYGISMGRLLGSAGPDLFVNRLTSGLTPAHGQLSLHVFPFGGIAQSIDWITQYRSRTG